MREISLLHHCLYREELFPEVPGLRYGGVVVVRGRGGRECGLAAAGAGLVEFNKL